MCCDLVSNVKESLLISLLMHWPLRNLSCGSGVMILQMPYAWAMCLIESMYLSGSANSSNVGRNVGASGRDVSRYTIAKKHNVVISDTRITNARTCVMDRLVGWLFGLIGRLFGLIGRLFGLVGRYR
jgi:hypothetical protein